MKILWISFLGSWTLPLLYRLSCGNDIHIIIPVLSKSTKKEEFKDGITFHYLELTEKDVFSTMTETIYKKYYENFIREINPDIIHIHGTEKNLAQIQNFIPAKIPVVISIQGLLSGCLRYNTAFLTQHDMRKYTSIKNLLGRGGLLDAERMCINGNINYEENILSNGRYYIGRTNWDKAHILAYNPKAHYFKGEELLRDCFYQNANKWNGRYSDSHVIFTTTGANPLKGLHFALKAIGILKKKYPDVRLVVPGMPKDRFKWGIFKRLLIGEEFQYYIKGLIKFYRIEDNVVFLPRLNENEMVQQLLGCNVFLSSSTIDNSPNSICEASMLGIPIVTTPVGGVTSFMRDEENCLFAPSGDACMMAFQIARLFDDRNFAANLGKQAYEMYISKHDREKVADEYKNIYRQIINLHSESSSNACL